MPDKFIQPEHPCSECPDLDKKNFCQSKEQQVRHPSLSSCRENNVRCA